MRDLSLRQQILAITDWRHPYDLGDGQYAPLAAPWFRDWHHWRVSVDRPILETILQGLAGQRILDVACNDGYHGFVYVQAGAKEVVGIDAKAPAIERANLIRNYFGYSAAKHHCVDIEDIKNARDWLGQFDLTLFYGILYHLESPLEVVRKFANLTDKVMAVQTFINGHDDGAVLRLKDEQPELPGHGTRTLVCTPSQAAVVKMLRYAGFDMVLRAMPVPYLAKTFTSTPEYHWAFFYGVKADAAERERIRRSLRIVSEFHPGGSSQVVEIDATTPSLDPFA